MSFALEKGAMVVVVFLLARALGAEDYGRLTLAQGLVNTLQIFIVLGAGSVLGRYIPAMRQQSVERAVEIINLCAVVILGTTAVFTLAALAWARPIAVGVLDLAVSSPIPYWMLAWVVLSAVNSLLLIVMLSFEKGLILGLVALLSAVVSIAAVPALAIGFGVGGAVAGLVIVEMAKLAALVVVYIRFIKMAGVRVLTPVRRTDLPLLLSFGLPVFLQSALWMPTIWLAQFIVKIQAPEGLVAVGVFGFANNLLGVVITISGLTNRAAMPLLSSLQARGEFIKLRRVSWLMSLGQAGAAVVVGLPLALAAPLIMSRAGPGFAAHWPVLPIMVAAGVVIAGQTSLGNYLLVKDRPYFLLATILPWGVIIVGAATIFAPFGAQALAWGLLAASIMRTALFFWGWYSPPTRPPQRSVIR